jgi:hypothetical protein
MAILKKLIENLDWTLITLRFIRKHLLVILCLGLIAAFGRAAQLRAFGEIPYWLHTVLEVVIQSARILIFLFALGLTHVKKGFGRFIIVLTPGKASLKNWTTAWITLRKHWLAVLLNLLSFGLIAFLMNLFIDHIAYQTCLYAQLQREGFISGSTSEWSLILFIKNISVIPLTLVFNATLLLWFTDKLPHQIRKA